MAKIRGYYCNIADLFHAVVRCSRSLLLFSLLLVAVSAIVSLPLSISHRLQALWYLLSVVGC